jgi:hypothetical protein
LSIRFYCTLYLPEGRSSTLTGRTQIEEWVAEKYICKPSRTRALGNRSRTCVTSFPKRRYTCVTSHPRRYVGSLLPNQFCPFKPTTNFAVQQSVQDTNWNCEEDRKRMEHHCERIYGDVSWKRVIWETEKEMTRFRTILRN